MKKYLAILALMPFVAQAQTYNPTVVTNAGAASQSAAGSVSNSVSAGGAGGTGGVGAANFSITPESTVSIQSTGSDLGDTVPLVSAPQMTVLGGEDSCLKSRSGGGAISGFGASFGTMVMDDNCDARRTAAMATSMGQSDVAMAVLCGLPKFWAAQERIALAKSAKTGAAVQSACTNEAPESAGKVQTALRDPAKYREKVDMMLAARNGGETPAIGPVPLMGPDIDAGSGNHTETLGMVEALWADE